MSNDGLHFSIQIPTAADLQSWSEAVRRAEDGGFYSVSVPDHLGPSLPQLGPLAALGAAAALSSSIRLAITVVNNDFRHPALLAKEIATLDVLSGGRMDLGLGAGWLEEDYTRTGITSWDPPGTRVDRLIESVGLYKQLLTGDPVTFEGAYYHVRDFRSVPKPVQSPVPLIIGGRGRRMLRMAAREAQIISILFGTGPGAARLQAFERQLGWIHEAGGAGRDDLQIGLRIPMGRILRSGESAHEAAAGVGERLGLTAEEVLASPFAVVGDHGRIKAHLLELAERYAISYITISEELAWQMLPVVKELGVS